jgi:hypothetical protein
LPTESASRMKQPVDTVKYVLVLYKLAPVGFLGASLHAGDEAGLIFEHACNGVFHQLLGVFAIGGSHLLEPRFNLGREMYFHALQGTRKPAVRQHGKTKAPEIRRARKRTFVRPPSLDAPQLGSYRTGGLRASASCNNIFMYVWYFRPLASAWRLASAS